jgi:Bacterial regulatory proteins, gntR family
MPPGTRLSRSSQCGYAANMPAVTYGWDSTPEAGGTRTGIDVMTVQRTMKELRDRGLVVARVGKGTFVASVEEDGTPS